MKYIKLSTWKVKCEYLSNWHEWFAWYPATLSKFADGAEKRIWFKWVLRKGELCISWSEAWWQWGYKEKTK